MHENQQKPTRRTGLIIISLLLTFSLLAISLPLQRAGAASLAVTCSTYHTVSNGETLSSIAAKYNVTVADLAAANDLKEPYTIFVGQRLCIPGSTTSTTPTADSSTGTDPGFTISAGKDNAYLTIKVANYPKKTVYYVRLLKGKYPDIIGKKVGTLKTTKTGTAEKSFRIPKEYRNLASYSVCLKNALTDEVQCKVYTPATK